MSAPFDAIILGAGGAGLMCALQAGKRGKKVLLIDHAKKVGGKILISGGGRCNFTNLHAKPENYASTDAAFCRPALTKFTPRDFMTMVKQHRIPFHEKKLGQLFCDHSAREIVKMLVDECETHGVETWLETKIISAERLKSQNRSEPRFAVQTSRGPVTAHHLIIATGGLAIPLMGATGIGLELAQQFGHRVVETAPALDGFVLTDHRDRALCALAGISLDCTMTAGGLSFRENLLFTHVGISGPAALQASLHWRPGQSVEVDLAPEQNVETLAREFLRASPRASVKKFLERLWPERLADLFAQTYLEDATKPLRLFSAAELTALANLVHRWTFKPSSTVGYQKAEVMRGGVDTSDITAKTLQSKLVPGLFFIGEVVDVTGWLGGFNFQWAWSSGYCAAQTI